MVTRDRWLDEGLAILREEGAAGLRADAAARRLRLTKGSFHHHFAGMPDYRRAVLDRYELRMLEAIDRVRAAIAELPPADAIAALPSLVSELDLRLDTAVRGWAFEASDARSAVERVDAERLRLLEDCWRPLLTDPADARAAALVPHLVAVGAAVAQPPPDAARLAEVFALLARIAPAVRGAEAPSGRSGRALPAHS